MICNNCGKKLKDDSTSCPICGRSFQIHKPSPPQEPVSMTIPYQDPPPSPMTNQPNTTSTPITQNNPIDKLLSFF